MISVAFSSSGRVRSRGVIRYRGPACQCRPGQLPNPVVKPRGCRHHRIRRNQRSMTKGQTSSAVAAMRHTAVHRPASTGSPFAEIIMAARPRRLPRLNERPPEIAA